EGRDVRTLPRMLWHLGEAHGIRSMSVPCLPPVPSTRSFSPSSPSFPCTPGLTRCLFLHLHARALLSSSIRLNLLGPYESQRLLTKAYAQAVKSEAKTREMRPRDVTNTFLVGDICQGAHERLWTRLFNS